MTAASPTLDAVLDHYERLAADPAADPRLRRAPLTTVGAQQLAGFLLSLAEIPESGNALAKGVCLRASMNLDTTFGRHLLLPHPVSAPGAHAGRGARAVGCRCAPQRRSPQADLSPLRVISTHCSCRSRAPPVRTDGLWRHTCFEAFIGHAGAATTGNTTFRRRAPGRPITSPRYREGMAPLLKGARTRASLRNTGGESIELAVSLDLSWLTTACRCGDCVSVWRRSSKTKRGCCHTGRSNIPRRNPISIMPTALWSSSTDRVLASVKGRT